MSARRVGVFDVLIEWACGGGRSFDVLIEWRVVAGGPLMSAMSQS